MTERYVQFQLGHLLRPSVSSSRAVTEVSEIAATDV